MKQKKIKLKPRIAFDRPVGALPAGELLSRKYRWPSVRLTSQAHGKMWALVQQCPIEIGWLSTCSKEANGDFVIDDVFVPDQYCSVASTTITKDGEANLLTSLVGAGRIDAIRRLNCWGHSHVNMAVFSSFTDEKQTKVSLDRCKQDYFLRLIANKRGELFCSVYLLDADLVLHHPRLLIESGNPSEWRDWARQEINTHVTREVLGKQLGAETEFDLSDIPLEILRQWRERGEIDDMLFDHLTKGG